MSSAAKDPLAIPRLASGGLIVTYRCTSRCRHCLYASSPRRDARYIDEATARLVLRAVKERGCGSVHVGGGEPFIDPEALKGVARAAGAEGVAVDYVETNSSWFRDPAGAVRLLGDLRDLGVSTLLVSISPFHLEHVPFSRVRGVLHACREAGMGVFPWVESFIPDAEALDGNATHRLEELEQLFGAGYIAGLPGRYWITMGGRAAVSFRAHLPRFPVDEVIDRAGSGCAELADTSHFHVDLLGGYVPGLCAGLSVDLADLRAPLDGAKYPLISLLHSGGVGALLRFARAEGGFEPSADGYLGKCDLCLSVRTHLALARGVRSRELGPLEFYREL